jgi:hypothetical protein
MLHARRTLIDRLRNQSTKTKPPIPDRIGSSPPCAPSPGCPSCKMPKRSSLRDATARDASVDTARVQRWCRQRTSAAAWSCCRPAASVPWRGPREGGWWEGCGWEGGWWEGCGWEGGGRGEGGLCAYEQRGVGEWVSQVTASLLSKGRKRWVCVCARTCMRARACAANPLIGVACVDMSQHTLPARPP